MRVGINFASGADRLSTGVLRLTEGLLRGLSSRADVEAVLFVTAASRLLVEDLVVGNLRLVELTVEALPEAAADVDVVHFPFGEMPFVPAANPSVVTVHDVIAECFPEQSSSEERLRSRRASHRATVVVTHSAQVASELRRFHGLAERRLVTAHGCLEKSFEDEDRHVLAAWVRFLYGLPDRFILCSSAYSEQSNHRRLLDCLQDASDIHLVLCESGPHQSADQEEYQKLAEFVASSEAAERVHLLGHVERHHEAVLQHLALAVIVPSLAEGFSLPLLEALALGTPVACSERLSLKEIAGDAAVFFDPEDRRSIAAAIRRVVGDQPLREALVGRGWERAKRFSPRSSARQLVHAYRTAIERYREIDRSQSRVAFDVWRLAHAKRLRWRPTGITQYARQLYERLGGEAEVELRPVLFQDMPAATLYEELEQILESPDFLGVDRSWRASDGASEPGPFAGCGLWHLYHSPVNPLPSKELTGRATRILTVHDCIFVKHPQFWIGRGKPAIATALESLEKGDFVICDSQATREDLHELVEIELSHTTVIPLAPKDLFREPRPELCLARLEELGVRPRQYLLALAQPEPRKNISSLVDAFARLRVQPGLMDYRLLLISPSPQLRDELFAELTGLRRRMEGVVSLVDVDDETLASLYANAALFVYPSLYEGFGLPVLEAMASGCPVVVSKTSCLPEVAGDAAEYCDPVDLCSLVTGMGNVLLNGGFREALIARGRHRAKLFTWDRTIREHLEFYRYALGHFEPEDCDGGA